MLKVGKPCSTCPLKTEFFNFCLIQELIVFVGYNQHQMSRITNQPSAREETQAKCRDISHKLFAEYRMRSPMTKIGDSTESGSFYSTVSRKVRQRAVNPPEKSNCRFESCPWSHFQKLRLGRKQIDAALKKRGRIPRSATQGCWR